MPYATDLNQTWIETNIFSTTKMYFIKTKRLQNVCRFVYAWACYKMRDDGVGFIVAAKAKDMRHGYAEINICRMMLRALIYLAYAEIRFPFLIRKSSFTKMKFVPYRILKSPFTKNDNTLVFFKKEFCWVCCCFGGVEIDKGDV